MLQRRRCFWPWSNKTDEQNKKQQALLRGRTSKCTIKARQNQWQKSRSLNCEKSIDVFVSQSKAFWWRLQLLTGKKRIVSWLSFWNIKHSNFRVIWHSKHWKHSHNCQKQDLFQRLCHTLCYLRSPKPRVVLAAIIVKLGRNGLFLHHLWTDSYQKADSFTKPIEKAAKNSNLTAQLSLNLSFTYSNG
jgi:hypothetical protein